MEVLLHELVHAAGYRDHGAAFRRVLLGAAREMTGVEVPQERRMGDEWFGVQRALRGRYAELGARAAGGVDGVRHGGGAEV